MGEDLLAGIGRTVVLVDDHDAALAFYRDVLGMVVLFDRELGGYRYLHLGVARQAGVGLWLMAPLSDDARQRVGSQTGGHPLLVLYTGDLAAARAALVTAGAPVWDEREDPDSASLHTTDPFGNVLVVAELHVDPVGDASPGAARDGQWPAER